MSREAHVRFWEGLRVKFPRATHLTRGQRCSLRAINNVMFRSIPKNKGRIRLCNARTYSPDKRQPVTVRLAVKNAFGFGMRVVDGFVVHDDGEDFSRLIVVGRLGIHIEQRQIHLGAEFVNMGVAR